MARERAYLGFLEGPPIEGSRAFWRGLIDKGWPFEVAVDDGRVVGWCDIAPIDRPVFGHIGSLGMGLLPSHRERGIGRRLIGSALDRARACRLERVELHVFATNLRARRLYESLGFVAEGTLRRRAKIDDRYLDEVVMALAL